MGVLIGLRHYGFDVDLRYNFGVDNDVEFHYLLQSDLTAECLYPYIQVFLQHTDHHQLAIQPCSSLSSR